MRSNYKKLGPYIRQVDSRNFSGNEDNLLGVSTQKVFIESIANTVGTDFTNYKIVKKKQFTYVPDTSRRGEKIGLAILDHVEEGLVSQAYTVFEIVDHEALDPEYLMMWFRRPEFDRYARFMSHGSVREIFGWEEMCGVELPVPSIEKQRELVREYKVVVGRIKLIEQLNQQLEDAEQAIYKHWFLDFEFPVCAQYAVEIGKPELEGKPYKSSGGEMILCQQLEKEVPKDWSCGGLNAFANLIDGDRGANYPSKSEYRPEGYCLFLSTTNVTKNGFVFDQNTFISKQRDERLRKGKLVVGDIVLTTRGSVGNAAFFSKFIEYEHIRINSGMIIIRAQKKEFQSFLHAMLKSAEFGRSVEAYVSGSAQQHLPIKDVVQIPVVIPDHSCLLRFSNAVEPIVAKAELFKKEVRLLKRLRDIIFAKMATQANELEEAA